MAAFYSELQSEAGDRRRLVSFAALTRLASVFLLAGLLGVGCGEDEEGGPTPDTTPPGAVTDLSVTAVTDSSATLEWTAPGDDGMDGTASAYDIRYGIDSVSVENWGLADSVEAVPAPQTAGTEEIFTVEGLDGGTLYYFALKAVDDGSNWSDLSNVVSDTTTGGMEPEEPILAIYPDSLDLGTEQSEALFAIANAGTGTLRWNVSAAETWLSASPDSGSTTTEEDEITVTVDRTGMEPGDYAGVVTVTPEVGDPQEVAVTLSVPEEPVLDVSPDSLDFGNEATEHSLTITNTGTGTLRWNVSEAETWLSVSPDSGTTTTEADEVTVTVDRDGLGAGDYTASITITPEVGDPEEIPVTMGVVDVPYSIPDGTMVIPEDDSDAIQGYEDGTITLDGTTDYAQTVAVGDIVIGQDDSTAPNGFLRKVASKTTQGDVVVLETETALMTEAFETMDISETHQLRPSEIKSMWLRQGGRFRQPKDDETFEVELDCIFFDQDGNYNTTDDQIKLVGDYAFTAALFANIEISWFTLQRFECGIETESEVGLDLIASLQWEFDEAVEFDLAEFHLGAIPIGGAVWIVPTLTVEAHVHGDLTVTFETGITYTETVTNGFGYAEGDFYEITNSSKEFTFEPPEFTVEFNFETGASLNMACLLYGVAGPYVAGRMGFQFTSVLEIDPYQTQLLFDLEAILYAVVGIECDILGLDYNRAFELYTHMIGEWVFPLYDPPLLLVNPLELDFGSGQTQLDLTITNGGDGTLNWSVADNRDWITDVSPPSGSTTTEEDVVTVTVSRDALDAGDYSGSVTVTPDEGDPIEVSVLMSVEEDPVPVLVMTPTELDFGTQQTELTFEITNGGDGTLSWTIDEPEESWIVDVDPSGGSTTTEADVVTVSVSRAGLAAGPYSGTVTVVPNGGSNQDVEISMMVSGAGPEPGEMVLIPAGTFTMGSPGDEYGRHSDETQHTVTLTTPFYLSSTEVTNQQYADLAQWAYDHGYCTVTSSSLRDALDGSTQELLDLDDGDREISFSGGVFTVDAGKEDHPVLEVTWSGSVAYCDWLSLSEGLARAYAHDTWECNGHDPYNAGGYRLPTEAEWEYACRAGTQTPFHTGSCLDAGTEANYQGNYPYQGCPSGPYVGWTVPVGSYPSNGFGLYDMHGNLWEWCNDRYGAYGGDETDPVGPGAGSYRVIRGGRWGGNAQDCRAAYRNYGYPGSSYISVGFRLARSAD